MGHVTYLEFWDPFISRDRLKLETSNLDAYWSLGVLRKKIKIMSKGS